ncbi:hypothetical protein [Flavobacterium sp. NRK F7]|uniref:hypothetical protein n=1 Tax=Flavobacterium sp. NRK F7 TaxID=2954930 RepID=UPI00209144E5|nr:hypothetical protein [Flavobacterium sp. NRK F7]MCO6163311.1 hypothetical protein [Flavobacterium sp. NRK F7]
MKKTVFKLVIFVIFTIYNVQAQTSAAAALVALEEIDAKVSNQINSIDNVATNAIGNSGNMILSMTSRLKKEIDGTIGNTDKILRESQQNLFNEILSLSAEFDKVIKERIDQIDIVATKIAMAANDFLVKKKEPNTLRYNTPPFVTNYTKQYFIKINGANFDRSDAIEINVDGKIYKPIQSNHVELVFKIDSSQIKTGNDLHYLQASIHFKWRKGLFRIRKSKTEPFIIPIVPFNIGNATVFYEQEVPERRYTNPILYSCDCRTGASNWRGDRRNSSTSFNFNPSGGRIFDPTTIVVTDWHKRYGGGYSFDHTTEQQIKGVITCSSDPRPYGGGGSSSLTFSYKEFDIIYKIKKDQTPNKEISFINPVLFDLPDPIDNKRPNLSYVKVNTYDNKEIILTPSIPNAFFKLNINPVTDDVIVEWKK